MSIFEQLERARALLNESEDTLLCIYMIIH
jgi:hypothetical protein